jgi:hypothetical protein
MSVGEHEPGEFEQRAREVLGDSVTHVSSHVRSRLNQARQAAVAEIAVRPRSIWRLPVLMPAAGATAAAAVLATVLITNQGVDRVPGGEGHAGLEDIELLSDREGLELIENGDGSFYEWAVAAGEEGDSGASG